MCASPVALVRIEVSAIADIPAGLWPGSDRVYAIGKIGKMRFGRTRTIAANTVRFDLTAEPSPWTAEIMVAKGEAIPVLMNLCDDQGDNTPGGLAAIAEVIADPWKEGSRSLGKAPGLECKVTTLPIPDPYAASSLPAIPFSAPSGAKSSMLPSMVCTWTEIKGLYEPGYKPSGVLSAKLAEYHAGYASEDGKGRIYLNRDLAGAWKKDYQAIQLTVKVTAIGFLAFPPGAKVKWSVIDPDDPGNDDPNVHRQWIEYMDPNDFSGGNPAGAKGGDNIGAADKSPVWEAIGPYSVSNASATSAETTVEKGLSSVIFHCPNTAGDNLILRAEVPGGIPPLYLSFPAITGVMTLWNRIDVENLRMTSAFALPLPGNVPSFFEKAFAQLDFAAETVVADKAKMGKDATLTQDTLAFVESVFSHKKDGGWFCVLSAMEPYALPAVKGKVLFDGNVDLGEGGTGSNKAEYVEIPGKFKAPDIPDFIEFNWGKEIVGFKVSSTETVGSGKSAKTRCWLEPHDAQDRFTAGDGSLNHAYATSLYFYPRAKLDGSTWTKGGYGVPDRVRAVAKSPGAFYVAGISPSLVKGGVSYFAGRTVLFSHHRKYRDEKTGLPNPTFNADAEAVIAHELIHAFGMPHKCGYWDYKTPRRHTCCMNYRPNWMLTATRDLSPGTSGKVGNEMCGRHLTEVRKVHLEDNKGLAWP